MIASSPRRASAAEAASSKTFHHLALSSRWWRSGSFAVTFLRAWTVQRCSSARGHSSLAAFERDAPGHQHTLGRLVVGVQLQVDGVAEQVDQVVLVEPPLAPAPVALAGVLEDARDGRARAD